MDPQTNANNMSSGSKEDSSNNSSNKSHRPPLPLTRAQDTSSASKRASVGGGAVATTMNASSLMTRSLDMSKRATPPIRKSRGAPAAQSPAGTVVEKSRAIPAAAVPTKKTIEQKDNKQAAVVHKDDPQQTVTMTQVETVERVDAAHDVVVPVNGNADTDVQLKHSIETEELANDDKLKTNKKMITDDVNRKFIESERDNVIMPRQEKIIKEIENLEKQQDSLNNDCNVVKAAEESSEEVLNRSSPVSEVMSASMMSKSKITTEEEAKAALAERRRIAREEAERQAEVERLRIEAAAEAERQRLMEEEERYRQLEVEANRLAEEQRKGEEARLAQAIEEQQRREEEDRQKREEDARQKLERDEQDKKAREEAEKQRIEMAEKLKKEEKEREERRKRVEAIMSRTRAKGGNGGGVSATSTPTKDYDKSPQQPSNADETLLATPEEAKTSQGTAVLTDDIPLENNNNENSFQNNNNDIENGAKEVVQVQQLGGGQSNGNGVSYEQSVTDKENELLGSFDDRFNRNEMDAMKGGDQATIPTNGFNGNNNNNNQGIDNKS